MQTISLHDIQSKYQEIGAMIQAFQNQPKKTISIQSQEIVLNPGEEYAGVVIGKDGAADYHLVKLPGEAVDIDWEKAGEWAVSVGGELPSRREQALLYANLKELFQERSYWSSEQHASSSSHAWFQSFDNGTQYYVLKSAELCAVAVRRIAI